MGAQVVAVGGGDAASGLGEIGGEIREVAPVGVERVRRRAALGGQHVEVELDQGFVGLSRPAGHARERPQRCLLSWFGGMITVICRVLGLVWYASA